MSLTTSLYVTTLFLAAVIMLALAIYGWIKRTTPAAPAFVWGMAADAAWTIINLLGLLSQTPESNSFWHKAGYLAVANVPLAWMTFTLIYTGREKWVTPRMLFALTIVPIIMVGLVWTNEWHHLFWLRTQILRHDGLTTNNVVFGPGGWISILYVQGILFVSAGLVGLKLFQSNRLYRLQTVWVLAGLLVPLITNAIYVFGLGPEQDLTTASFALSGLLLAAGIFWSHLLDLAPIARDKVIESMTDAIIVLDYQGRVVDLNPTAQHLLGQTPAQAMGQAADECFRTWPALAEAFSTEPAARRELTTGQPADNFYYDLRQVPLTDRRGQVTGCLLVLADITKLKRAEQQIQQLNTHLERRVQDRTAELEDTVQRLRQEVEERHRAEVALRESEARYRTLVEISPDAIVLTDLAGQILMANPQAHLLFANTSAVNPQGINSFDFVAPQDRKRARANLQKILESQCLTAIEYVLQRDDQTQFTGELSTSLVSDDAGQPTAIISIIRDITGRQQAEALLRRRQATLELLNQASQAFNSTLELDQVLTTVLDEVRRGLDAIACSIWLTDPITGEAVCREATGPQNELVRGWRLPRGEGIVGWLIEHGTSINIADAQTDLRHYTGVDQKTQLPLRSLMGVPLRGRQGTLGVIEVAHLQADHFKADDLTFLELLAFTAISAIENAGLYEQAQREIDQRRRAEETLSAANQRLQALSRQLVEVQETERRRLALELHDELGQMLNSIKLSLDLIPANPASESQEPLRRAQRLIGQLIQQVRQLALDLRPAMLDDLGLVPALKSFFRRQTSQTGLQVNFENGVADNLRFASPVETAAYRIIQEGVTNVTRHAGVRFISVELQANDHTLSLKISDQGKGFDPTTLLTQPASTGLTGMRERARLLGGDLIVDSAPGAGTCLYANLPLR
jgi:PAS domain S-box-containing protein